MRILDCGQISGHHDGSGSALFIIKVANYSELKLKVQGGCAIIRLKKGRSVKKRWVAAGFLLFIFLGVLLISDRPERSMHESASAEKTRIAVSTFALYDIVSNIAGDNVELFMVVPFGTDLHSFEPTPKDLVKLNQSALFIYSGAGLEPWAESFEGAMKRLDISRYVTLRELEQSGEEGAGSAHHDAKRHDDDHEDHDHEGADPHYWLDPTNMIRAAEAIEQQLGQLMPRYAKEFYRNREVYITQLHMLDNRFKSELGNCKQSMIVVNHNAFGYLAERYGFDVVALTGLSPESMPSAKRMAELSDLVREHHLNTIFFESFVSDRLIREIGNETGAAVETLQPLGNITADEVAQRLNYIQLMERNIGKIKTAMECE